MGARIRALHAIKYNTTNIMLGKLEMGLIDARISNEVDIQILYIGT